MTVKRTSVSNFIFFETKWGGGNLSRETHALNHTSKIENSHMLEKLDVGLHKDLIFAPLYSSCILIMIYPSVQKQLGLIYSLMTQISHVLV